MDNILCFNIQNVISQDMICVYNTVWWVVSNMLLTVKSVFYFIKTPQFLTYIIILL